MWKCGFQKVLLQLYWNRTLAWVFSYKSAEYFQNAFCKDTPGRLHLLVLSSVTCSSAIEEKQVVESSAGTPRQHATTRSSRPEVLCKKGVLRNFAKFIGKHLCQNLFFNKVALAETLVQVFTCEFCEISKNTFSYKTTPVVASVRRCLCVFTVGFEKALPILVLCEWNVEAKIPYIKKYLSQNAEKHNWLHDINSFCTNWGTVHLLLLLQYPWERKNPQTGQLLNFGGSH